MQNSVKMEFLNKSDSSVTMWGGAALVPPHSGYTASRSASGVRMCGECEQQSRADKAVRAAYTIYTISVWSWNFKDGGS